MTQQGWLGAWMSMEHCGGSKLCTMHPQTGFQLRLCTGSGDAVKQPGRERGKEKEQGLGMLMPGTHLVKSSSPIMCRGMGEYREGVTWGGTG